MYSAIYEQKSDSVYVTDSGYGTVLIFDRELNYLKKFSAGGRCYGIRIDEYTGYCYICHSSSRYVSVYK